MGSAASRREPKMKSERSVRSAMFIAYSDLQDHSSFRSDVHFALSELKIEKQLVNYKYFVPNGTMKLIVTSDALPFQ